MQWKHYCWKLLMRFLVTPTMRRSLIAMARGVCDRLAMMCMECSLAERNSGLLIL